MKKYSVYNPDLKKIVSYSYIGCNHTANNIKIGGCISSYDAMLTNEDTVYIENGIGDIRYAKLGNINEAYEILKKIIKKRNPKNFFGISECIMETVNLYFGNYSNVEERLSYFPTEDEIYYDGASIGTVSSIAHKNAAMCVERSMVSQNLLKSLNINSYIKIAGFINNAGIYDVHAFNLVSNSNKYYIFDTTQPTLKDNVISPIVAELPKDVYEQLIMPIGNFGVSVHVKHFNPLTNKDYDVIYDAGRLKEYDTCSKLKK